MNCTFENIRYIKVTQLPHSCVKIVKLDSYHPSSSLSALLSQEREAQEDAEAQPCISGPSESEVALQEALSTLQQEKDALTTQYQAQVFEALTHS